MLPRAEDRALSPSDQDDCAAHGKRPLSRSSYAAEPDHAQMPDADTHHCGIGPAGEGMLLEGAAERRVERLEPHLPALAVRYNVRAEVLTTLCNDRVRNRAVETATMAVGEAVVAAAARVFPSQQHDLRTVTRPFHQSWLAEESGYEASSDGICGIRKSVNLEEQQHRKGEGQNRGCPDSAALRWKIRAGYSGCRSHQLQRLATQMALRCPMLL